MIQFRDESTDLRLVGLYRKPVYLPDGGSAGHYKIPGGLQAVSRAGHHPGSVIQTSLIESLLPAIFRGIPGKREDGLKRRLSSLSSSTWTVYPVVARRPAAFQIRYSIFIRAASDQ